jgi:hypothetical protein
VCRLQLRNVAVGSCPPLLVDPEAYVETTPRRLPTPKALVEAELHKYAVIAISAA